MVSTETQHRTASTEVVATIADAEGVDPVDLPPMFDVIDPDALDAVVASTEGDAEVVFEYHGHVVTVTTQADDRVTVRTSEL